MKHLEALIAALALALPACTTNPTTGAKTVDFNQVIAGIQTGCAHQVQYAIAANAAANAVKLSVDTVGHINDAENLISIGCALVPPATAAAPATGAASG